MPLGSLSYCNLSWKTISKADFRVRKCAIVHTRKTGTWFPAEPLPLLLRSFLFHFAKYSCGSQREKLGLLPAFISAFSWSWHCHSKHMVKLNKYLLNWVLLVVGERNSVELQKPHWSGAMFAFNQFRALGTRNVMNINWPQQSLVMDFPYWLSLFNL